MHGGDDLVHAGGRGQRQSKLDERDQSSSNTARSVAFCSGCGSALIWVRRLYPSNFLFHDSNSMRDAEEWSRGTGVPVAGRLIRGRAPAALDADGAPAAAQAPAVTSGVLVTGAASPGAVAVACAISVAVGSLAAADAGVVPAVVGSLMSSPASDIVQLLYRHSHKGHTVTHCSQCPTDRAMFRFRTVRSLTTPTRLKLSR